MPTVVSTTPANGATGVATNTVATIICSRPVDANSLMNMNSIMMSPNINMTMTVDPNNPNQINLSHATQYANSTTYTHTVNPFTLSTDEFEFTTFSWSFTTAAAAPPPVAPTVVSVTPSNNATGVIPLHASITIQLVFSEAMDGTTINNTNITLKQTVAGTNAPCTVTLGGDNVTVTMVPSSDLLTNTQYTITATTSVKAAASVGGLALASQFTSKFTTEAAPTVNSFNPANGATGVATNVAPTITFNQAMNPSSITTSTCNITGVTSTVALDSTHKIVTITPSANLANSTSYTINATTGCQQADGVPLGSSASSSFTTIGATPTVTSTNPANAATGVATSVDPTITFSIPMDTSSINTTNVYMTDPSNATVSATVALDSSHKIATITPNSGLSNSATYTLHATTGCTASGVALASAFSSTFTTAAPSYTLVMNFSAGSCTSTTWDSSTNHMGFGLQLQDTTAVNPSDNSYPLFGAKIKKVIAQLKSNSGTLSGTIYCRIRSYSGNAGTGSASGGTIKATIGSVAASTITSSYTGITFVNDANTYALAESDAIIIEWPGDGSTASGLELGCSHSSGWSHGNGDFYALHSDNSISENSNGPVAYQVYI